MTSWCCLALWWSRRCPALQQPVGESSSDAISTALAHVAQGRGQEVVHTKAWSWAHSVPPTLMTGRPLWLQSVGKHYKAWSWCFTWVSSSSLSSDRQPAHLATKAGRRMTQREPARWLVPGLSRLRQTGARVAGRSEADSQLPLFTPTLLRQHMWMQPGALPRRVPSHHLALSATKGSQHSLRS